MPTPQKTKEHYKKIRYHLYRLQTALNNTHSADVIVYQDYKTDGPCSALDEVRARIEKTTAAARATAFKELCLNELKGVW